MGAKKHYILTNLSGDICLVYRATGSLSDAPFPIMMRDEWGRFLPFTEKSSHNRGCVPADLNAPSELFSRIEITEEDFALVGHPAFYCYYYDKQAQKISLRPGHRRIPVETGVWGNPNKITYRTEVNFPNDLELCNIAYGGRPIYWIRWTSDKSAEDFPELVKQGCLHPRKYKPREVQRTYRTSFPSHKTLPPLRNS